MKIAIFYDEFRPLYENKDPGQLVLELKDIGTPTKMITIKKDELINYAPPFELETISIEKIFDTKYWNLDPRTRQPFDWNKLPHK